MNKGCDIFLSSNKACRYFDEGRGSCPFGGNCFYKHAYPDGRREEPQRQKVGTSSRCRAQRRNHFWELIEEQENGNPFDDEEEVVTFELGEMLLMLLAAGGDDDLTDCEDEWDLLHDELEGFSDSDLSSSAGRVNWSAEPQTAAGRSPRQASQLQVLS